MFRGPTEGTPDHSAHGRGPSLTPRSFACGWLPRALVLVSLILVTAIGGGADAAASAADDERSPVLLELFTSQGSYIRTAAPD